MTTSRKRAALATVEAAYRLDGDQHEWLEGLLDAARPTLDAGGGVFGFLFELTDEGRFRAASRVVGTLSPELAKHTLSLNQSLPANLVAESFGHPRALETASSSFARTGGDFEAWNGFDTFRSHGVADSLAAKGLGPEGRGVVLGSTLPTTKEVSGAAISRWQRVITHVISGMRLRRRLARGDCAHALLDGAGRLVHAEGEAKHARARQALRETAKSLDAARARGLRGDVDDALRSWQALVAGRWSLVDRFDSDGRRFLVARRNDPELIGPTTLSRRERQVLAFVALGYSNKAVAYALGLAPSTVSSQLRAGMRKIGAATASDVARLFRWRCSDLDDPTQDR